MAQRAETSRTRTGNKKRAAHRVPLFLFREPLPRYRDIMFMVTLCITHSVPTIRIAAVSTV